MKGAPWARRLWAVISDWRITAFIFANAIVFLLAYLVIAQFSAQHEQLVLIQSQLASEHADNQRLEAEREKFRNQMLTSIQQLQSLGAMPVVSEPGVIPATVPTPAAAPTTAPPTTAAPRPANPSTTAPATAPPSASPGSTAAPSTQAPPTQPPASDPPPSTDPVTVPPSTETPGTSGPGTTAAPTIP